MSQTVKTDLPFSQQVEGISTCPLLEQVFPLCKVAQAKVGLQLLQLRLIQTIEQRALSQCIELLTGYRHGHFRYHFMLQCNYVVPALGKDSAIGYSSNCRIIY